MTRSYLAALLLVPTFALACAKDKSTENPDTIELSPEAKVPDETEKPAPQDGKVVAKKVEPAKPATTLPQDRDPNQEKAKMKRSRDKSAKAKQLLRAGQGDKAITEAREALRDHEQNVEAMLVIAEAFYKQRKHELVLSVTGSILKVDAKVLTAEEKSQAYNLMGFAYLQAGGRGEAFESFKSAAETDEHNASAWNNLGVQYMWRGQLTAAESCFEYAVGLDPKFAEAQLNWGAALRVNGKLVEAEAAFREAAKLRPDWAEVHFNLGVLYLDAEQIAKLDETAKLNAAIAEFNKYKALVSKGGSSIQRSDNKKSRGSSDAMGNELVSVAQADLYIKAATKSIDAEARRKEREQKRKTAEAAKSSEPSAEPSTEPSEDPQPDAPAPAPAQPSQPSQPQKPGGAPPEGEKPADPPPAAPSEKPQAPSEPKPQKPKPQKPGG